MSKRNFILLIIVLLVIVIAVFGFLFFRKSPTTPGDEGTGTNFFSPFNPFGTKPTPPAVIPPVDVSGYVPPPVAVTPQSKLMKVSTMPVAGFAVFSKERLKEMPEVIPPAIKSVPPPTEFMPAIRYVAKATGNIYQTFADKIEEKRFSGTIIPRVYDAYFGNRGESVVMRHLKADDKTIETFAGNLPKELLGVEPNTNNEIKGSFLPDNIRDISVSPDTSKIFYLFSSVDNMIGTTLNFSNNQKVQLFNSPFTEWLSQWPNNNIITLSTKPASGTLGYMYAIDSAGRNLSKTLGGINGLTTLESPNGKLVLYGDDTLSLYVYHTDTKTSDVLGLKTLPEKCVWGGVSDAIYCAEPKSVVPGSYPDSWYQGEVSFFDRIWKINVKNGTTSLILDPTTIAGGEEIDGIKLALDQAENYLFFINKKDNFLWKLDLK